jgi:hypothetical protein
MVFNSLFILFSYGNKKGVSLFLANIRLASIVLSFFWTAAVVHAHGTKLWQLCFIVLIVNRCGRLRSLLQLE